MLVDEPKALDYIDGVAVHFYTDFITPATVLTEVMKGIPQKFLLATEACEGKNILKLNHECWLRFRPCMESTLTFICLHGVNISLNDEYSS